MKKMLAIVLSAAGGAISLWAAYILISGTQETMYGYHAVYGGLFGLAVVTTGLVMLSNS
ncbi:MAG: hypothetical protein LC104_04390 [Bacteroidales bacterium]|nr:hypothetical protein [Bacteroidales bacterium]